MCCVIESGTELSNTVIYSAEVDHPTEDGVETVHVLGYQNSVTAYRRGPNAMILPIPALGSLGPANVVDASGFKDILSEYHQAIEHLKPKQKSFSRSFSLSEDDDEDVLGAVAFEIIDSGAYTVALSNSAAGLNLALKEVPSNKRPHIPEAFLDELGRLYPEWPIAICCFDMQDMRGESTDPIFWWYRPRAGFENTLFAPAIDAHDGRPPRLDNLVRRDHTLIFGSKRAEQLRLGAGIGDKLDRMIPAEHRWMFTSGIRGGFINNGNRTKNGDFTMLLDDVLDPKKSSFVNNFTVYQPSP